MPASALLWILVAAAAGPAAPMGSGLEPAQDAKNQDPTPAAAALPNIVFVLADDLGYADLGAYGQQKIRTPSIDRLAAEGMRFTRHYAGNAVCAPSRSVLMTGLHPGHTPIRDNKEVAAGGPVAAAGERRDDRGAAEGPAGTPPPPPASGASARPARRATRSSRASTTSSATTASARRTTTTRPTSTTTAAASRSRTRPSRRTRLCRPAPTPRTQGLRRVLGPAVRARSLVGEGARVRAGEPRPAVLPLRPDDGPPPRAPGARGLARRVPRDLARDTVPRRPAVPADAIAARRVRGDGDAHGPRGRPDARSPARARPRRAHDRRLHVRQRAHVRRRRHRLAVLRVGRRPARAARARSTRAASACRRSCAGPGTSPRPRSAIA